MKTKATDIFNLVVYIVAAIIFIVTGPNWAAAGAWFVAATVQMIMIAVKAKLQGTIDDLLTQRDDYKDRYLDTMKHWKLAIDSWGESIGEWKASDERNKEILKTAKETSSLNDKLVKCNDVLMTAVNKFLEADEDKLPEVRDEISFIIEGWLEENKK